MSEYFLVKPFLAGEVNVDLKKRESEQIIIIDTISRDDLIYCKDGCFLITPALLKALQKANLTDINVLKPKSIKFSAKHNIAYPNQTMPVWYRIVPFTYDLNNKKREVFLDHNGNLIINSRINNILDEENKFRLKHTKKEPYEIESLKNYVPENLEQAVFKKEIKNTKKEILSMIFIILIIAYVFFKN